MNGQAFGGMLFVLIILSMVFGFVLLTKSMKRKDRERREDRERTRYQDTEFLTQLESLEERVRVLERIVTDDPNELRRQFRDLER